jgi:predicted ferric reductase
MTLHPHRPPLHDHPFSIASAPGDLPMLRLIVRESGDCTRDFGMIALGTQVAIDGPHGSFVLRDGGNRVVMIAGGVGIAPILGMLEHAALVGDRREFRLLFAARSGGMLPGLSRIAELGRCLDLKTEIFIDQPPLVEGARPGPIRGEDIADAVGDPERTSAYVCGPQGLMSAVTDMFLDAGLQARDVHYERFDFGAGGGRIDRARQGQAVATLAAVGAAVVAFSLT